MKDYTYHETQWLDFWKENQSEISEDETDWVDPEDLAETFFADLGEADCGMVPTEDLIQYSAGVYLGHIEV